MKRLLRLLGFCDLVWVYRTGPDPEPRLRILRCDRKGHLYARSYGSCHYELMEKGQVNGYMFRWILYKRGNKPPSLKTRWCVLGPCTRYELTTKG